MNVRGFLIVCCVCAFTAPAFWGCGGEGDIPADTGPGIDTVLDTGSDTGPVLDTGSDTGPVLDTATDTGPVLDTATDTSPEPDTATDAGPELDTESDSGSAPDTATDTGPVLDTATDTGPELDSGPDTGPPPTCEESELSSLYSQYVEPFVSGSVATSCSQCHMTGIDISMYAQDTPCETMACMVSLGAVDLDDPDNSQLLSAIQMGNPNSSIYDVDAEYQAMAEWINWSSECHAVVCAGTESPCASGTGAPSTGINPIGDCTEQDLLVSFWDAVIIDRQRCLMCHSDVGLQSKTFGDCLETSDCEAFSQCLNQQGALICQCLDDKCRPPGPFFGPNFLEGPAGEFDWSDPTHRQLGLNTMYNVVALDLVDENAPLNSAILTKPLLEDFYPTAIYGPGVAVENVPVGMGMGINHGGSSKFTFGCHTPPCPTSGVVDCRMGVPCTTHSQCSAGKRCLGEDEAKFCRLTGSYCDVTYTNFVRFVQYFAQCKGE